MTAVVRCSLVPPLDLKISSIFQLVKSPNDNLKASCEKDIKDL